MDSRRLQFNQQTDNKMQAAAAAVALSQHDTDYSGELAVADSNQLEQQQFASATQSGNNSLLPAAAAAAAMTNEVEIDMQQAMWGSSTNTLLSPDIDNQMDNSSSSSSSSSGNNLKPANLLPILARHKTDNSSIAIEPQLLRLQQYNLLYNATRQTYFRLHSCHQPAAAASADLPSRLLQQVVSSTLSAALGFNVPQVGSATCVQSLPLYDAAALRQTRYNPFQPTRILIHGWLGNANANIYGALLPAYLQRNYNIITVDWGRGAIADYITASYRVKSVGQTVAKFIDFLHQEAGMRFEDLQLIGFSMGAHVAGIAGKHVQTGRLRVLRALDPALPFFRYAQPGERLSRQDADYVEVLHTSVGSYGFDRPLGHADFYANWGSQQPGCFLLECSHWRAFALYAESLSDVQPFVAHGCNATCWQDLVQQRRCQRTTGQQLSMGGDLANLSLQQLESRAGVYYFDTNAQPPYGKAAAQA